MKIVITKKANQRLIEIADYLYRQHCSKKFVITYLNKFKLKLKQVLIPFPESGTLAPEYGKNVRCFIYKKYSFLYEINDKNIVILTIFRENLA
ncbi:MAG: type II toxin-antitoxin system RelE/ParE family toxin [Pseudomonadota bacterium]